MSDNIQVGQTLLNDNDDDLQELLSKQMKYNTALRFNN